MDIESTIAAASRAQQAEEAGIGNCAHTLHIGLFFDGTHRNIEQDAPEQRLSNVARLYRAYPYAEKNTSHETYFKLYISGLGTPFLENAASQLHSRMDDAQSSVMDDLKGQPEDIIKESGFELLKGVNWYEVLKSQAKKLVDPLEWKKLATDTITKALKKVAIESVPRLRDNPIVSDMLVTGVTPRINSAIKNFEDAFEIVQKESSVPVKLISISLFGFDLGATLARKFTDTFLDNHCQKQGDQYAYQDVPISIIFTGLFDCSRHTPASSKNGLGEFITWLGGPLKPVGTFLGEKSIAQESPLNPAVKKSLHLVAAHENRLWRTLYRLGSESENCREELLPGCAEDIGGGLKPDEQKPSAELCRVALQRMYREATMAGVPFPDFQTLDQTDTDVASYFIMQDNVDNKSVEQWVKRYQSAVPSKTVSTTALNNHMDSYINWLGIQYYQYRTELQNQNDLRGEALTDAALSTGGSAGLLGISPQSRAEEKGHLNKIAILKEHWGWLEDVRSAALLLTESMENNPHDTRRNLLPDVYEPGYRRAKKFLSYAHSASQGKPLPLPDDYAPGEIFAYFVHDIQAINPSVSIAEDFFLIRLFDEMEV